MGNWTISRGFIKKDGPNTMSKVTKGIIIVTAILGVIYLLVLAVTHSDDNPTVKAGPSPDAVYVDAPEEAMLPEEALSASLLDDVGQFAVSAKTNVDTGGLSLEIIFDGAISGKDFATNARIAVRTIKKLLDEDKLYNVEYVEVRNYDSGAVEFSLSTSTLGYGTLTEYAADEPAVTRVWINDLSRGISYAKDSPIPTTVRESFRELIDEEHMSVQLSASDVQYNMSNNLDKCFYLEGTATLSTYYNYGFDDSMESSYYCIVVTPTGGSHLDRWYIYCHRRSFDSMFERLSEKGSSSVHIIAEIPRERYKSGQGNMAEALILGS